MSRKADALIEPLTGRELEILALLATNHTNREIAASLSLSVNSVKWYARQIYGKLGIENRHQIATKASELGLLVTPPISEKSLSLPTGTVTFLFTDVVSNVPLWEHDPLAMKVALGRHHEILHAAAQHYRGVVFKILGDEFQIAFDVPGNALEAALEAQRLLREEPWGSIGPLTVRMGLHTGPVEFIEGVLGTPDHSVSHTINRVARIRSAAHGGQILLSSATAELLHGYRPQEIHLCDLGEVYLKGMSIPEHVFQVVVHDLPDVFPPLISISHPLQNLPVQLTSFIGREKETTQVTALLQDHRLVTLTGAGGVGKTRLALRVAEILVGQMPEVGDNFKHGIWLVELAPLGDGELIPRVIASLFGIHEDQNRSLSTALLDYLSEKHLLLFLDNCEHLIESCAELVDTILRNCPGVKILASSREALGIEGEVPFYVPSLPSPDLANLPPMVTWQNTRLLCCSSNELSRLCLALCSPIRMLPASPRSVNDWMVSRWPSSLPRRG